MPTLDWLLRCIIKWWPPKAKAPPLSLFFDGACVGAPHKRTSHGATIPNGVRLSWTHGEPRCHELGAPLLAALPIEKGQNSWRVGLLRLILVVSVHCFYSSLYSSLIHTYPVVHRVIQHTNIPMVSMPWQQLWQWQRGWQWTGECSTYIIN